MANFGSVGISALSGDSSNKRVANIIQAALKPEQAQAEMTQNATMGSSNPVSPIVKPRDYTNSRGFKSLLGMGGLLKPKLLGQ